MVTQLRYILLLFFTSLFMQSCCICKQSLKRILLQHEARSYSYASAMGKGHGLKLTIVIDKTLLNKEHLIIDSLFVHNTHVDFKQNLRGEQIELEYNNYYQQPEPSVNTDGSIQTEKNNPKEINATNLVPTYILLHNHKRKYRLDITHFSTPKP